MSPFEYHYPKYNNSFAETRVVFPKTTHITQQRILEEKKCNILKAGKGHMKAAQDSWLSNVFWNNLLWFFGRTVFIVQVKFFTVNKMVSCRYWKYLPCQIPQEWKPSSWLNNETEIIPTNRLTAGGETSRILYDPNETVLLSKNKQTEKHFRRKLPRYFDYIICKELFDTTKLLDGCFFKEDAIV